MRTVVALASLVSAAALRVPARAGPVHMSASKGPFLIPQQPANFAGAQWAPECFKPFPINVKPAANAIKELMEEAGAPAAAAVVEAPAAPPAEAAPVDADKTTFTVTLKNPDGDQVFECPPDMNILDQTDELDVTGDLPYACRAGSCSACAGKLVSCAPPFFRTARAPSSALLPS